MASICSKEDKDLISGLPDDVLSHILSFLPLEDSIKSTLLLKRFRNIWRSFSKLTLGTWSFEMLDHSHSNDEKLAKLINHILIYHDKDKIHELSLWHCFFFEYSKNPRYSMTPSPEIQIRILEEKRFAGVIDSFVSFAIIKRCKVLTLDFVRISKCRGGHELQQGYILPTIVYRSIYLTKLTLGACDVTSCDEVCLKSLKLLCFRTVVMSDEAMQKFMLGCPSLEELSIHYCYGLNNLCCSSVKLKRLMIELGKHYSLTLSNLNVDFLKISGMRLQSVVVVNSNVVDAQVFSFEVLVMHHYDRMSYEGFKFLLQSLDQCTTFRPCTWSLKMLAIWEMTNIPCPYFKWKHLVLSFSLSWLTSCVQVGLAALLRHVPLLETLKIYFRPKHRLESTLDQKRLVEEHEFDDEEKYWNEAKANLVNLKIVVIHGCCFTEEPAVIHVAKFILRNAVALEEMVVSPKEDVDLNDLSHNIIYTSGGMKPENDGNLTDGLTCFLENLVASPKASTKAKICFE